MYVCVCQNVSMYTTSMQCSWRPEAGVGSPGAGVTGGCKPPGRCWEINQGPLKDQKKLIISEPSLQPQTSPLKLVREEDLMSSQLSQDLKSEGLFLAQSIEKKKQSCVTKLQRNYIAQFKKNVVLFIWQNLTVQKAVK